MLFFVYQGYHHSVIFAEKCIRPSQKDLAKVFDNVDRMRNLAVKGWDMQNRQRIGWTGYV